MKNLVQLPNPVTKRWCKIDTTTGSIKGNKKSRGAYKGIEIYKAVRCDCGHRKDEHYNGEGSCSKCACTWFHPAIEFCAPVR